MDARVPEPESRADKTEPPGALLAAYLIRIGFEGAPRPDRATLEGLHLAHVSHVPFENLDIQMGRRIRLDLPGLEAKLVRGGRGGYCFEQNTLFQHVLSQVGFEPTPCEARVWARGSSSITPRTHMINVVTLAGRRYLCDVGFGGDGPVLPVPMDGEVSAQFGADYRVLADGPELVLQMGRDGVWEDQYVFLAEGRHPIDFEVANWYTSTHPSSRFVTTLTAQRALPSGRHVLRNLTYTVTRDGRAEVRQIARPDLMDLLAGTFGITLPPDTRFAALDGPSQSPVPSAS